jgi:hypothetical protein
MDRKGFLAAGTARLYGGFPDARVFGEGNRTVALRFEGREGSVVVRAEWRGGRGARVEASPYEVFERRMSGAWDAMETRLDSGELFPGASVAVQEIGHPVTWSFGALEFDDCLRLVQGLAEIAAAHFEQDALAGRIIIDQDALTGRIIEGMRNECAGFDEYSYTDSIRVSWVDDPGVEVWVKMAGARGDPSLGSVFFGPKGVFKRLMERTGAEFETLERRGRSALHGCFFQMPRDQDLMVRFTKNLAQAVAGYSPRF